jgi:hypothetical protein
MPTRSELVPNQRCRRRQPRKWASRFRNHGNCVRKILIAAGAAAICAILGFWIGHALEIEPRITGAIGALLGALGALFICRRI